MGRRGPLPKPTSLKAAAGNPGKRRLNDAEPLPPPGVVVPPEWLSEGALRIWSQMAPIAITMQTLTVADALTFGRYCESFARYIELKRFLMNKGASGTTYVVKGTDGKSVRYVAELPQAAEYRRLHEILIKLEEHFGFTPAARSRIQVEKGGASPSAPATAPLTPEDQAKQDFFRRGGPEVPPTLGKKGASAV